MKVIKKDQPGQSKLFEGIPSVSKVACRFAGGGLDEQASEPAMLVQSFKFKIQNSRLQSESRLLSQATALLPQCLE